MPEEPRETPQGIVAAAFARALVDGEFGTAFEMLGRSLPEATSPARLKAELETMIEYGHDPPDSSDVITILDDWPAKEDGDLGWAYAAINGDGYCVAISVVVSQERGKNVIRSVEWGRP